MATTNMGIYRPDLKCEEDSHGIEPATGRSLTFDRDYPNADNCSGASSRWFVSQGPSRELRATILGATTSSWGSP